MTEHIPARGRVKIVLSKGRVTLYEHRIELNQDVSAQTLLIHRLAGDDTFRIQTIGTGEDDKPVELNEFDGDQGAVAEEVRRLVEQTGSFEALAEQQRLSEHLRWLFLEKDLSAAQILARDPFTNAKIEVR